jgi:hypothetical protein
LLRRSRVVAAAAEGSLIENPASTKIDKGGQGCPPFFLSAIIRR